MNKTFQKLASRSEDATSTFKRLFKPFKPALEAVLTGSQTRKYQTGEVYRG